MKNNCINIIIEVNQNQFNLIQLFKEKQSLSAKDNFGGWGDTEEFRDLASAGLIYHYNYEHEGAYIAYKLTDLALSAKIISM